MVRLEKRGAEQKAKQVDRLEYLYGELVGEWHRSKLDAESIKTTDEGAGDSKSSKTETTVKGQTGNPALIAQARGTLEDIRSILGLDAPKQADVTTKDARAIQVNILRRDDAARKPKPRSPDA